MCVRVCARVGVEAGGRGWSNGDGVGVFNGLLGAL